MFALKGDEIAQSVECRASDSSPDELQRVRGFEARLIQLSRHSPWYRLVGTIDSSVYKVEFGRLKEEGGS